MSTAFKIAAGVGLLGAAAFVRVTANRYADTYADRTRLILVEATLETERQSATPDPARIAALTLEAAKLNTQIHAAGWRLF